MLARLLPALVNFVLPPTCASCDNVLPQTYGSQAGRLCAECFDALSLHQGPRCAQCATRIDTLFVHPDLRCGACLTKPPPFAATTAPLVYAGTARQLILGLKHGQRRTNAKVLADFIRPHLPPRDESWLLIPVPLHPSRLRQRGFNQSLEIARNLPGPRLLFQGLKRTRATDSQANKSARARARNVAGAFAVTDHSAVKGANILLIDDVVTSGATARAAAKTLRRAGARCVHILAAARALPT